MGNMLPPPVPPPLRISDRISNYCFFLRFYILRRPIASEKMRLEKMLLTASRFPRKDEFYHSYGQNTVSQLSPK